MQQNFSNIQQTGYVEVQPSPGFVQIQPNVVVQQPLVIAPRDWTHSFCGCFDDMGECCCAYFCWCCYVSRLTTRIGESYAACIYGGLVPMRTKVRTERKIQGSIVGDYFAVSCCPFCSAIQMSKEARDTKPLI